jgi:hypothetical protein
MGTGIVSEALAFDGYTALSGVLLAIAVTTALVLVGVLAACGLRVVSHGLWAPAIAWLPLLLRERSPRRAVGSTRAAGAPCSRSGCMRR